MGTSWTDRLNKSRALLSKVDTALVTCDTRPMSSTSNRPDRPSGAGLRARVRAELTEEIKAAARRQLAEHGASDLSLRAVARELEMVSSAVYRYFSSRDELLTALIVDAYDALGAAVERAEAIIDTQVGRFMQWMQQRENVPLIRALREGAEAARREELERALARLSRGADPAQVMEQLSQALTNKLMHGPTQAIGEGAGEDRRALSEALVRLLAPK